MVSPESVPSREYPSPIESPLPRADLRTTINVRRNTIVAVTAPVVLFLVACVRLTAQGMYYDELHQAIGALAYVGHTVSAAFLIGRYPALNMSYSGAIKTALYGLYLRLFHAEFSVVSWRLTGLLLLAAGLLAFGLLLRKRMPGLFLPLFSALLISDVSVLLMSRHDWGPAALALALRLLFLGVWLRGGLSQGVGRWNSFWLGLIAALAIFEKLSSVVLILPLLLILTVDTRRRNAGHWLACLGGGLLGSAPLIVVNTLSLLASRTLVSLSDVRQPDSLGIGTVLGFTRQYLSLGSGSVVKQFICGVGTPAPLVLFESLSLLGLLTLAGLAAFSLPRPNRWSALAGTAIASYAALGVGVRLLPQGTWCHHWIVGTPFQYVALCLCVAGLQASGHPRGRFGRFVPRVLAALLIVFLGYRCVNLSLLEGALRTGRSSADWDPGLTRLAEFSARRGGEMGFIAADWGVALQMGLMGTGRTPVEELTWSFEGEKSLTDALQRLHRDSVYLVFKHPPTNVAPARTARMLPAMRGLPGWREVEVDAEVRALPPVRLYKFVRVKS